MMLAQYAVFTKWETNQSLYKLIQHFQTLSLANCPDSYPLGKVAPHDHNTLHYLVPFMGPN